MALPLVLSTPGWVMPGAKIDLDFANERYYGGNVSGLATSGSNTQGSLVMGGTSGLVYYAPILDPFGGNGRVVKEFAAYEVRVTRGYGLWSDGIRTNSCLGSRDFTSAQWTKTNCTAARVVGSDGKNNSGSSMTATGANATCLQAVAVPARMTYRDPVAIVVAGTGYTVGDTVTVVGGTGTAATFKVATVSGGVPQTLTSTQGNSGVNIGAYTALPTNPCATTGGTGAGLTVNITFNTTYSAYVKRITGTGTVWMTYDNSTFTDITSLINSSKYTLIVLPVSTTFAGGTPGFKLLTSGDAIAVDHNQCDNSAYNSTPQVTTTTAITGTADEPAHSDPQFSRPGAGYAMIRQIICNGSPWSMFMSASGNTTAGSTMLSDGGVTAGTGCNGGTANFAAGAVPATATSGNTGTFGLGNINKITGRIISGSAFVCLNGGAIASGAGTSLTPQSSAFTHIGVNNNGSGQSSLEGYIKRLAYWNRELTNGEMIELTRSNSIYGN